MDGYLYHAEVMTCSVPVTSADALLTVKTNPEIIHQPQDTTICSGGTAEFRISARGTGLTFRWQRNSGGGFIDITDNSNFSGSTDSVLVITDAPGTFNNNIFRVIIDGDCGITLQSNIVALRVNMPPAVNLNPVDQSVCDGSGPVYFVANGSGMIDSLRWQVNIEEQVHGRISMIIQSTAEQQPSSWHWLIYLCRIAPINTGLPLRLTVKQYIPTRLRLR